MYRNKYLFKSSIILLSLLMVLSGCSKTPMTEQIIANSLNAHGGTAAWEAVKSVLYEKEIQLFDSLGQPQKTLIQKHYHQWQPSISIMEWNENGRLKRAEKSKSGTRVFENGADITNTSDTLAIEEIMTAAQYVYWQPYNLLDKNAKLTYNGKTRLLGNQEVHSIKVSYSDAPNADLWHYYFDTSTFRLAATQVRHKGRTSLVMNESVETNSGLYLNKIRKSYILRKDGTPHYLIAAYDYRLLQLEKNP